jgi:hypothetical protein
MGLKVNAEKLTFCALEIEYLGYILTRDGIKPQSNKVQAILAIQQPTNVKQLRHFLGMVQYYRDLWTRWSKMLAPLTSVVKECGQTKVTRAKKTKKVPWHWDEVHQRAFNHIKATIAREVVLTYLDFSKVFEIYTDASSKQLGAVTITQKNRPIAFFSRKLSTTQCKYSVTEIELLGIVETLKKFKGMLWGQSIKVYTDHANLIRDALGMTLDPVYQYQLLLEEYGPKIVYIKGIHNTVADTISRLEYDPSVNQTAENYHMTKVKKRSSKCSQRQSWMTISKHWCNLEIDTNKPKDLNFVFANQGEQDEIYPLTTIEIAEAQRKDQELKAYYKKNAIMPKRDVCLQLVEDTKVLCKNGKLIIFASLQCRAVAWYHRYLQHPGHSHLEETMRSVMYWKGMHTTIQRYVKSCRSCQVNKRHSLNYGHIPPKFGIATPSRALCVDLVGPYTLKGKDGSSIDFMCLAMINPATSWFKIVELPTVRVAVSKAGKDKKATCLDYTKDAEIFDKTSAQISNLVYKCLFSRYPHCHYMIYNKRSEFKLHFRALCKTYGIKRKPTSIKNPIANAILKCIHAVFTNMLRTAKLDMAESVNASDIDIFLADAAWTICSTHHTLLKASPGAAIFGQDMLFDIPFIVDWRKIGEHRQELTDLNTVHENKGRIDYDYKVAQKILVRNKGILCKNQSIWQKGPWTITTVHTNGTITIQRRSKEERLNIRRVKPFEE